MILADLTRYLAEHRRAAVADLAWHFDAEPEAVRGMLELLCRKGRVRRIADGAACGGCTHCAGSGAETFEWIEPTSPAP